MPPKYVVMRRTAGGGREFLDRPPRSVAGPDGEPDLELSWARKTDKAHDFSPAKAQSWAEQIDGARFLRIGDAPPEEAYDVDARDRARKREAREKYAQSTMTRAERRAAGIVTRQDREDDARAAEEERLAAIAAALEAEQARLDAVAEAVDAARPAPSFLGAR